MTRTSDARERLVRAAARLFLTRSYQAVGVDERLVALGGRVAEQIVSSGIHGIFNFAPIPLVVPPSISVMTVDLSVQLEHLAYKVRNGAKGDISHAG